MEVSTAEIWMDRVARWRASGEKAETFSRSEGYAANTLRCWASKLKDAPPPSPTMQLARVIRTPTKVETSTAPSSSSIAIDVVDAGVRIVVEVGADAGTLAMVLEVVRGRR